MYPATPSINKGSKSGVKIEKIAMLPAELMKKQEMLRAVPVK